MDGSKDADLRQDESLDDFGDYRESTETEYSSGEAEGTAGEYAGAAMYPDEGTDYIAGDTGPISGVPSPAEESGSAVYPDFSEDVEFSGPLDEFAYREKEPILEDEEYELSASESSDFEGFYDEDEPEQDTPLPRTVAKASVDISETDMEQAEGEAASSVSVDTYKRETPGIDAISVGRTGRIRTAKIEEGLDTRRSGPIRMSDTDEGPDDRRTGRIRTSEVEEGLDQRRTGCIRTSDIEAGMSHTGRIRVPDEFSRTGRIRTSEIEEGLAKGRTGRIRTAEVEEALGRTGRIKIPDELLEDDGEKPRTMSSKEKKRRKALARESYEDDDLQVAELGYNPSKVRTGINKRVILAGAVAAVAIVLVILVIITTSVLKKGSKKGEEASGGAPAATEHAPETGLDEDQIPGINQLMEAYYAASARGDVASISELQDYVSDMDKIRIEKKADYIEEFKNISCYTKEGPVKGTYLLYVYNEVKIKGIDTLAPALNTYVIYTSDDGRFYIHEGDLDESTLTYFQELSTQDNVTNLCNTVQAKYNEAIGQDQALAQFMESFPRLIQEAVDEASSAMTADVPKEEPQEEDGGPSAAEGTQVEALDKVNVRISDSQESDRVGQVEKGTKLTLIENRGNGWSKIMFEGQPAYIKTEFLREVGGGSAPADGTFDSRPADTGASEGGSSGTTKKMRATTNVNIRDKAAENGNKLGTLSGGQTIEVVEIRNDGWAKVRYSGKDAYVKSEFLE